MTETQVIAQTANWINSVVIGCNFCPFAAKAVLRKSIRYIVAEESGLEQSLELFSEELKQLDQQPDIETSFIIFPKDYSDFSEYLDLVDLSENLARDMGYDGIYQVASFHPEYCFADADAGDPANYTNRSVFPMLHILRESSITAAVEHFPDPEVIPENNMTYARRKGLKYMQLLRLACME